MQIKTFCLLLILLISPFQAVSVDASHLKDGIEAYEKGEYDKALKHFIDAQLDDPENPEISYNIGNSYYRKGDFESAAGRFKETLNSEDPKLKQKALYNLGNTNFKRNDYEEALKNFEAALNIDPNDIQAKENIEFVKKVIAQKKKEQKQSGDQKDNTKKEEGDQKKEDKKDQEGSEKDQQAKSGDKHEQDKENEQNKEDAGQQGQQQKQDFGKEADESMNQQAAGAQEQKPEETGEEKQMAQAKPGEEKGEKEQNNQAARMLNRLQDQPGKAMIPSYGPVRVEKDW